MRILFLLARRVPDVTSPLVLEVSERLEALGHHVEHALTEDLAVDACGLAPSHDLYVLKSHTELALSVAGSLAAQGARLLNGYDACAAAQDKLQANRRLHAAGVPVPRTHVTADPGMVAALLEEGPKVVKPLRGHRGEGMRILRSPRDLTGQPVSPGPLVVQDLVPGPGEDLKVYVVGQRVWAVRKAFSPTSFTRPGRPVAVTPEVESIALRAGAATGLGIFGLDMIEGPEGPVVVDLNYFPGYKGCDNVAAPMTRYVDDYARGTFELLLPALWPVPVLDTVLDTGLDAGVPVA